MAEPTGFLGHLTPSEAEDLLSSGRTRRYRRDEHLMREGDPSSNVAVIRSGRVKVVKVTLEGREVVLSVKGRGDLLGEISTLDGDPRTADVVAVEPVEAVVIPATSFEHFLETHHRVALVILRIVVRRLRDSDRRRAEFGQNTASRLARHLLDLVDDHGQPEHGGAIRITLPLTHEELAAMVGASRETVSRALARFRNRGMIASERRSIRIVDLPGLRREAETA